MMYVYGQTKTGRGQRRLDAQNRAMVERNKANDDQLRVERQQRRSNGRWTSKPARPFAEVFAEAEQIRQYIVEHTTPAEYNKGTDRLKAATAEAETWVDTAPKRIKQRAQRSRAA